MAGEVSGLFSSVESWIDKMIGERPSSEEDKKIEIEEESGSKIISSIKPLIYQKEETGRAQELYELLICVGYVITSENKFPQRASSVSSLLRLLGFLGFCAEEEAKRIIKELKKLVEAETEEFESWPEAKEGWAVTDKVWIRYRGTGSKFLPTGMKLSLSAQKRAEELLEKFGLTKENVREAQVQKQRARAEQIRAYKKQNQS